MNKLTFTIEKFSNEIEGEYDAFFYLVDGKKIQNDSFIPNSMYEILTNESDWIFSDYKMIILNRCSCTSWECDSLVATIIEDDNYIKWKLHNIRDEKIINEYIFEKNEYKKTIKELENKAKSTLALKNGFIFHYANGDSYPMGFMSESKIIDFWNQVEKKVCIYYEDLKSKQNYKCINGKIEIYH